MKTITTFVVTFLLVTSPLYGSAVETPPPAPADEQPEVLTRGPVHEAFAAPVEAPSQPGLVAPSQPPANIIENPPAQRPVGSQFVWAPGYWAWDGDRNSYIWISGCWRAAPPNMAWISGYWSQGTQGWQWVPGFWTPTASAGQIEYLPPPPAAEETQVPDAPSTDSLWVPACWYWYQGQYVQRPGYWVTANPDWVWMPSHYAWTPRGYVFVSGYWDYGLDRRGVLFAPVYFPRSLYLRPGFSYPLSIVVDTGRFRFGLFTCPRYRHYYFGDYYDDSYIGLGIYPWFAFARYHTGYDPIYTYDRWRFRKTDPRWDEHERDEYDRRRNDKDLRPPRTYRDMENRLNRLPEPQRRDARLAEPLSVLAADKRSPLRFETMKGNAQDRLSQQANDVRSFREQRSRWESPAPSPKTGPASGPRQAPATQPQRVKVPNSPVTSPRNRSTGSGGRPPSRPADERKTDTQNDRGARGGRSRNN